MKIMKRLFNGIQLMYFINNKDKKQNKRSSLMSYRKHKHINPL